MVVVQTAKDRNTLDAALSAGRSRDRLLLGKSLVRSGLVVEAHVLGHETPEVRFADDQDVVEELPADGSGEALCEGVHVGVPAARAPFFRCDEARRMLRA